MHGRAGREFRLCSLFRPVVVERMPVGSCHSGMTEILTYTRCTDMFSTVRTPMASAGSVWPVPEATPAPTGASGKAAGGDNPAEVTPPAVGMSFVLPG